MGWVQSRYTFPHHGCILTVTRQDAINFDLGTGTHDAARLLAGLNGESLEPIVRSMLVKARPELRDCTLWWIDFNPNNYGWEIGLEHPSLPALDRAAAIPREPLFTEAQQQANREAHEQRHNLRAIGSIDTES